MIERLASFGLTGTGLVEVSGKISGSNPDANVLERSGVVDDTPEGLGLLGEWNATREGFGLDGVEI